MIRLTIGALFFLGCVGGGASSPCEDLCSELVVTCRYEAYPGTGSCLEGCAYAEQQGADIVAQSLCVIEAECSTFNILECEHEFGE
jgi:disulfide bond formation protein DsbB